MGCFLSSGVWDDCEEINNCYGFGICWPYILHTDTSTTGLGAALYQEQHRQLRVFACASQGLIKSKARYPANKLEFLALKWAITTNFCQIGLNQL